MIRVDDEGVWPGWDGQTEIPNSTSFCVLMLGYSRIQSRVHEVEVMMEKMAN